MGKEKNSETGNRKKRSQPIDIHSLFSRNVDLNFPPSIRGILGSTDRIYPSFSFSREKTRFCIKLIAK